MEYHVCIARYFAINITAKKVIIMHRVFFIAMEHNYTWKPDIHVLCRREKLDIYEDYFLVQ